MFSKKSATGGKENFSDTCGTGTDPMSTGAGEVTLLLRQWSNGDKLAESALFELLLPDLRRIAACCLAKERPGHTLQPTALVNEAFFRLAAAKSVDWRDRGHFLALSARVMRRYLIDYWRAKPEVQFLPMELLPERVRANYPEPLEFTVALDRLLEELANQSRRQRAVVELKFFWGLGDADAAEALCLPLRTLQRDWLRARKWLFDRLTTAPCRNLHTTNG